MWGCWSGVTRAAVMTVRRMTVHLCVTAVSAVMMVVAALVVTAMLENYAITPLGNVFRIVPRIAWAVIAVMMAVAGVAALAESTTSVTKIRERALRGALSVLPNVPMVTPMKSVVLMRRVQVGAVMAGGCLARWGMRAERDNVPEPVLLLRFFCS